MLFRSDERNKVKIWADAIHQKASLVNYTEDFFHKIQVEERKRVELWAEAYRRLVFAGLNEDVTFYLKIIEENTNIPVILTDEKNNIKMTYIFLLKLNNVLLLLFLLLIFLKVVLLFHLHF